MISRIIFILVIWCAAAVSAWSQTSPVQMSVLPSGRAGVPNEAVTFLATIANSGEVDLDCQPRFGGFLSGLPNGVSGQARFFEMDAGVIVGTANAPTEVPAGGSTDFLVEITLSGEYTGALTPIVQCTDGETITANVDRLPILNDFQVDIANGAQPDIIMIGDTLSNDGVARIGSTGPRAALMTVAAVNIGDAGTNVILAPDVTGFSSLHNAYQPTICETDGTGACLAAESETVTIANWAQDEVRLFAVRMRVPAALGVPFYPDILRLRVFAGERPVSAPGEDRPAVHFETINQIMGTSVAPTAEPREGRMAIAGQTLTYQCAIRVDADSSAEWAREGGLIAVGPGDNGTGDVDYSGGGRGYIWIGYDRFTPDFRRAPVAMDFDPGEGSGAGRLHVWGQGDVDVQDEDGSIDITVTQRANGALIIRWTGDPLAFENDWSRPGRTRCAPAPAQENEPDFDAVFDASNGDWEASTERTWRIEERVITPDDGEAWEAEMADRSNFVAEMFHLFFMREKTNEAPGGASGVASGGVRRDGPFSDETPQGVFFPMLFDETGAARCGAFVTEGYPENAGSAAADTDAEVLIITRTGETIEDMDACAP